MAWFKPCFYSFKVLIEDEGLRSREISLSFLKKGEGYVLHVPTCIPGRLSDLGDNQLFGQRQRNEERGVRHETLVKLFHRVI